MIVGIGTDVFAVKRLADAAIREEDAFFKRAYTLEERQAAGTVSDRRAWLAGRFAAKEAVYKAVSDCGVEFRPGDVCIITGAGGEPQVSLHGKTKARFEQVYGPDYSIHLSISHEDEYVTAFAVAEREDERR